MTLMEIQYDKLLRERITELRLKRNVSERRMSLDLGKSDSYIRGITSGAALPSLSELFNIIEYFGILQRHGIRAKPSRRASKQDIGVERRRP